MHFDNPGCSSFLTFLSLIMSQWHAKVLRMMTWAQHHFVTLKKPHKTWQPQMTIFLEASNVKLPLMMYCQIHGHTVNAAVPLLLKSSEQFQINSLSPENLWSKHLIFSLVSMAKLDSKCDHTCHGMMPCHLGCTQGVSSDSHLIPRQDFNSGK